MPPPDTDVPASVAPASAAAAVQIPGSGFDRRSLRRLPGRASSVTRLYAAYQLWMSPDFLLQVKNMTFSQEIQQFAYRDIQALEMCESNRGLIYNIVLILLTVFWITVVALTGSGGDSRIVLVIGAAFFAGLLLINLLRGPTCHCLLQTVLGPQALPSLSRRRAAQRAMALIAERAEAAQGAKPGG